MLTLKATYETERELADVLGMPVDEFCVLMDGMETMIQKENALLLSWSKADIKYIEDQLEREKETMPW